ncbi:MAG TPA: hypothetical protein VGE34_02710 [Candidatus Saccharimonadales bacterium]
MAITHEQRVRLAGDGYATFCAGIWVIGDANNATHFRGEIDLDVPEKVEEALECAELLLRGGADDVIRSAFPNNIQTYSQFLTMHGDFEKLAADARDNVHEAMNNDDARAAIDSIDPLMRSALHLPFLGTPLKQLARGNLTKIHTHQLVSPYVVDKVFRELLIGRTMTSAKLGAAAISG